MLPPSLEILTVYFPKIAIYEWLRPLTEATGQLSRLTQIWLHCSVHHNDSYVDFTIFDQPNKTAESLRANGVNLFYSYVDKEYQHYGDS